MEYDRTLEALLDQAAVAVERVQLMQDRARDAARAETEALRTALLTSLGHDLRTPLTTIRGAAETLRSNGAELGAEVRDDLLASISEEAVRMNRFLVNILEMVRIEAGGITPRREQLDLAEAMETATQRMERRSGRRVGRELPANLPQVKLDPVLLDQVLGNLLDNAMKFSGPGGQVTVRGWREGAEVALAVEDDGPGIPPADLARVFNPFFRVSRTDRVAAGSGLGLAICRGLVGAMGGRILAESPVAAGKGTRILLHFPA
jgi:two-component system sensor histidine kinase KdpD